MDLRKNGSLLRDLRKARGMTQKDVADRVGVVPKTVSKWETGHGFPDVSTISALADVLGVSERILLSGDLIKNGEDAGNMKRTKFFVCSVCGNLVQTAGQSQVVCCGQPLQAQEAKLPDEEHAIKITEIENDYYLEFSHEMTKAHYLSFVSYVTFDRVMTVKLYPEQDPSVRLPKMPAGKIYYFCSKHGLFEHKIEYKRKLL